MFSLMLLQEVLVGKIKLQVARGENTDIFKALRKLLSVCNSIFRSSKVENRS